MPPSAGEVAVLRRQIAEQADRLQKVLGANLDAEAYVDALRSAVESLARELREARAQADRVPSLEAMVAELGPSKGALVRGTLERSVLELRVEELSTLAEEREARVEEAQAALAAAQVEARNAERRAVEGAHEAASAQRLSTTLSSRTEELERALAAALARASEVDGLAAEAEMRAAEAEARAAELRKLADGTAARLSELDRRATLAEQRADDAGQELAEAARAATAAVARLAEANDRALAAETERDTQARELGRLVAEREAEARRRIAHDRAESEIFARAEVLLGQIETRDAEHATAQSTARAEVVALLRTRAEAGPSPEARPIRVPPPRRSSRPGATRTR